MIPRIFSRTRRRRRKVRPVGNLADRMEKYLIYFLFLVIVGSVAYMVIHSVS